MLGAVYRAGRARLLIGGRGAFQPGPNRGADMSELADAPPGVAPTRPSPARLYDYFLGGTNNFPADREAAEYLRARIPDVADALWAHRGLPRPGGGVDGQPRYPAVPRHRVGPADAEQHPRVGAQDRPGSPRGVRGQRPDGGRARRRAARRGRHDGGNTG